MRDVDRIAEKIEIALDRRQVVSIVLGSTILLGVVFYLGVTVGKELAQPPPAPIAGSLDDLDREAERIAQQLTFPDALTDEPAPPPPSPTAAAEARVDAEEARRAEAARREAERRAEEAARKAETEAAAAHTTEQPAAAAVARAEAPEPAAPAPDEPKREAQAGAGAGEGGAFTVQVGAMPNRAEADALVAQLRSRGLSPYVVEADIPGKGHFYRVRIGRFPTREAAQRYLADLKREAELGGFVAQAD